MTLLLLRFFSILVGTLLTLLFPLCFADHPSSLHILMHHTEQSIIIAAGDGANKQQQTGGVSEVIAMKSSASNSITGSKMHQTQKSIIIAAGHGEKTQQ
jgi:hypothetical protein